MSSRWTNKSAILQDLAYAQGSSVPVDIENPLLYNEKPPREVCKEEILAETEEELYRDCLVNGDDFNNGPDIGMIQVFLGKVRYADTNPHLKNGDDIIDIDAPQFIHGPSGDHNGGPETSKEPKERKLKKKKKRNVAIESLIEAYGEQNTELNEEANADKELKLLKPNDFMLKEETSHQDKAENRLQSPANMFRKKTVTLNGASMFKKKNEQPIQNKTENARSEIYVPTSMAQEYYTKYIERNRKNQELKETVWTLAEKKMKENEEKRKNNNNTESQESIAVQNSSNVQSS